MFLTLFGGRIQSLVTVNMYMILILRAWQTSHKGQQSLTKLNAKQVAYKWKFF